MEVTADEFDALVERAAAGLVLAWFDGRRWEFDAAGRPVRTWAGPGTSVRFVHEDDRLVELVHEHGRTVTVEWDRDSGTDRVVAVSGSDGRRVDYRYADGVLYRVNPQNNAINSVVALLTGQPLNVGQTPPAGYDIYNVPYAYRNQYVDGPNANYRYNDGYVYQVDPTTQLIQAAIQLLA